MSIIQNFYNGNNTICEQVAQNTADIAELKKAIVPVFTTAAEFPAVGSSAIVETSAIIPVPTAENAGGFVLNTVGLVARIDSVTEAGVTLTTVSNIKGADGEGVIADDALSDTSTNPVQNKVIDTAFNAVQSDIQTTNLNVSNVASQVLSVSESVQDLQTTVTAQGEILQDVVDESNDMRSEITTLQGNVSSLSTEVGTLDTRTEANEDSITGLDTRVTALENAPAAVLHTHRIILYLNASNVTQSAPTPPNVCQVTLEIATKDSQPYANVAQLGAALKAGKPDNIKLSYATTIVESNANNVSRLIASANFIVAATGGVSVDALVVAPGPLSSAQNNYACYVNFTGAAQAQGSQTYRFVSDTVID